MVRWYFFRGDETHENCLHSFSLLALVIFVFARFHLGDWNIKDAWWFACTCKQLLLFLVSFINFDSFTSRSCRWLRATFLPTNLSPPYTVYVIHCSLLFEILMIVKVQKRKGIDKHWPTSSTTTQTFIKSIKIVIVVSSYIGVLMNYVGSIPKSTSILSVLVKVLRSQTARHRKMKKRKKKFPSHSVSYREQHNFNVNVALSYIYASQPWFIYSHTKLLALSFSFGCAMKN